MSGAAKPTLENEKGTMEFDFSQHGVYKLVQQEGNPDFFDRVHYLFPDIVLTILGGPVDSSHKLFQNCHEMTAELKGSGLMSCKVHEIFKHHAKFDMYIYIYIYIYIVGACMHGHHPIR